MFFFSLIILNVFIYSDKLAVEGINDTSFGKSNSRRRKERCGAK